MPSPSSSSPPGSADEEAIFFGALELDAEGRADYLDRACGGDAVMRARIDALLRAERESAPFFSQQTVAGSLAELFDDAPGDPVPPTIPRYRLLEKLGEGGCGVVYRAEQTEPVRREVALKVIKPGMDTRAVIRRFAAERQTLARMTHPHIAAILDAGATEQGRPYFAMELVAGERITAHCDRRRLGVEQRLRLFILVCEAIQHAHQKGVIHRDIKPSNILVTEVDGVAAPKVIDFGISKAVEAEAGEETPPTQAHHLVGTPAYMSPEQIASGGRDLDTRSDIYALGVVLYELLAGERPLAQARLESSPETLRETLLHRDPPRPSVRLLRSLSADGAATPGERAAARDRLARVRGDLDWIVMRCLEKDRARRYETASALALDLRRHLSDEPVSARPASFVYQLAKAVRRHRLAFVAGTAVLLALVAGGGLSAWQAVRATRAGRVAEAARTAAEHEARLARRASARSDARMFLQSRFTAESYLSMKQVFALGPEWEDGYTLHQIAREARGRWALAASIPGERRPRAALFLVGPEGVRLALATGVELRLHDAAGGRELAATRTDFPVERLLPGDADAFVSIAGGVVTLRDRANLEMRREYRQEVPIVHASAKGDWLLLLGRDGVARLLDRRTLVEAGRLVWSENAAARELPPPDFGAVSPDGKLAVLRGGPWDRPAVLWDRRDPAAERVTAVSLPAQRFEFIGPERLAFWRMVGQGDSDEVGYIGVYRLGREPQPETMVGLYSPDLKGQVELQSWTLNDAERSATFGLVGNGGVVVRTVSATREVRTTNRFHNLAPLSSEAPSYVTASLRSGLMALWDRDTLQVLSGTGTGYGTGIPVANQVGVATDDALFTAARDAADGTPRLVASPFDPSAGGRVFRPDWPVGEQLASVSCATAAEVWVLIGETSANGRTAASVARVYRPGAWRGAPEAWPVSIAFPVEGATGGSPPVRFAALSADGAVLMVWTRGAVGARYDLRSGKRLGDCELGSAAAKPCAGGRVATILGARRVRVYDVASGAVMREWSGEEASGFCFSGDGSRLAVERGGGVDLLEVESGRLVTRLPLAVEPLAYSPEAGRLLGLQRGSQGPGGMLVMVDATTGRVTEVLERSAAEHTPAWFDDDGRTLAMIEDRSVASIRRSLRLEDLPAILAPRPGHEFGRVPSRSFARDAMGFDSGRRLVPQLMLKDINEKELKVDAAENVARARTE